MKRSASFVFENFLVIVQGTLALHEGEEFLVPFGVGKDFCSRITVQQLLSALMPEHAHQRIVDFDKASVRATKEEPFLNVVEQLVITTFGFAAVGYVFQNMNRLQAFAAGSMHLRCRDQIGQRQNWVYVFIDHISAAAAERARSRWGGAIGRQQSAHIETDELLR